MSEEKKNQEKNEGIPFHIYDAITSLSPEFLINMIRSQSSPSYQIESFVISDILDNSKKIKKEKDKEYTIGNYLVKKTLGKGTFGKVKLGVYIPTGEKVAIKILEKNRIREKDDQIRVKREFNMQTLLNHPNVILVAEIFESNDNYYSVMEYCEGGELFNYIVKNRRLDDSEAAFFYFQLINGLEYIHSLGIVHRDLKPENLLLTKEHLLKIIDFGLSNYFKDGQKLLLSTPCGSPCYASPEMVSGKKYNGIKIDIWSTGIILYAMLCGYLPFEDKDNDVLFQKILECKLIIPKYISKNAKDLMEKILVTDPEKRITIKEIKNHPFYLKGKKIFEKEFIINKIGENIIENKNPNKNSINNNLDNKENINENYNNSNIKNNMETEGKENSNIITDIKEVQNKIVHKKKEIILKDCNEEKNTKGNFVKDLEKNVINSRRQKSNKKIISINKNNPEIDNNNNINKNNDFVKNKLIRLKLSIHKISDNKLNKDNKLNIKSKSRETKDNKHPIKINNDKHLKKPLIKKTHQTKSPEIKNNIKQINNDAIKRKKKYENPIKNKNSKIIVESSLNRNYLNNTKNSIETEKCPKKIKLNFHIHVLNSKKDKKKTNEIANLKLLSYQDINKKKSENIYLWDLFDNNSNKKKYEHHLTYTNKKKNKNIFQKNEDNIIFKDSLKPSIKTFREKSKDLRKIKGLKNTKYGTNSSNKAKSINNDEAFIKIRNTFENKFFNIKNKMNLINKKYKTINLHKQKDTTKFQINEDKYIKRTFDREKNMGILKHYSNLNSNIKENSNNALNNLLQSKTIDSNNDKNNIISINISNLDNYGIKNTISKTENFQRKNEIKKIEKNKPIIKNKDKNLNKKQLLLNKNLNNTNDKFNTIDTTYRLNNRNKNKKIRIKKKNLNIVINENKENKNVIFHKKNIINDNKSSNSNNKKNILINKKNNIISNKSNLATKNKNNSNNFNKNPFINESNNSQTLNSKINYNFSKINNPTLSSFNKTKKNSKLLSNIKKKKNIIMIRNTFINFNLINSQMYLSLLDKKNDNKQIHRKNNRTNSFYSLYNNRLNGLCKKFNNENSINYINNNLISENISKNKTKKENNKKNLNCKIISDYKENKKINIFNKLNKQNKIHINKYINDNSLNIAKNEHFNTEGILHLKLGDEKK